MDLSTLKAADILEPSFYPLYKDKMEYFWPQLIRLNNNLYIVEQILHFPFSIFADPIGGDSFFRLVRENFLDMSVVIVHRLLNDTGSYKIRTFKGDVMKNIHDIYKPELKTQLGKIDLKKLNPISEHVRAIRHTRVAHAEDKFAFSLEEKEQLAVEDLMTLRDCLNELFNILSFGERRGLIYPSYDADKTSTAEADIVHVLDNVAFNSPLFSLPERQPDYWTYYRPELTEDAIRKLNHYRWKKGLPPV